MILTNQQKGIQEEQREAHIKLTSIQQSIQNEIVCQSQQQKGIQENFTEQIKGILSQIRKCAPQNTNRSLSAQFEKHRSGHPSEIFSEYTPSRSLAGEDDNRASINGLESSEPGSQTEGDLVDRTTPISGSAKWSKRRPKCHLQINLEGKGICSQN